MKYDIFFSISQTPVGGVTPNERTMFENFFRQVELADRLGYGTAWVAEAHLSTQVQKSSRRPVVPHWAGEVGLNTDIFQLSNHVFARTKRIETGAAIMNLLCNGGPIAAAERVATFASLHGLDPSETRRVHLGFSGGRFEFMNRPFGIDARDPIEAAAWPALRGQIFGEATEIFLRLLRGDVLSSDDIRDTVLTRDSFRNDEDWARVKAAAQTSSEEVWIRRRYVFESLQVIPREWRRDLVQLVLGSHDTSLQIAANQWLPVQVFNLSITQPAVIEETHARMTRCYHPDGGPWQRSYMPRTVFVFLNERPGLTPESRRTGARQEAQEALGAYWKALEGTIDPAKVDRAADNALIGNAEDVAQQALERFHPEDRLMLWFDFFNHDCDRVMANIEDFMTQVVPRIEEALP